MFLTTKRYWQRYRICSVKLSLIHRAFVILLFLLKRENHQEFSTLITYCVFSFAYVIYVINRKSLFVQLHISPTHSRVYHHRNKMQRFTYCQKITTKMRLELFILISECGAKIVRSIIEEIIIDQRSNIKQSLIGVSLLCDTQ